MTGPAQCAVQIDAVGADGQRLQTLVQQHRLVAVGLIGLGIAVKRHLLQPHFFHRLLQ